MYEKVIIFKNTDILQIIFPESMWSQKLQVNEITLFFFVYFSSLYEGIYLGYERIFKDVENNLNVLCHLDTFFSKDNLVRSCPTISLRARTFGRGTVRRKKMLVSARLG